MKTIKLSKEQAQEWLKSDVKELQDLAKETYPELLKNELPKSWDELEKINGYFVYHDSYIKSVGALTTKTDNQNVFKTKQQAESALAMAKLSQLMAVYNGDWVADWSDDNQFNTKYCIVCYGDYIQIQSALRRKHFLALKDRKTAQMFLDNFREEIEIYFNF